VFPPGDFPRISCGPAGRFDPPVVSTFSIVAIDPSNGDLGIAVASHYFSVGSVVPWAEAGVGAVATQAHTNVGYGPWGLELLRQGLTAQEALRTLLDGDPYEEKNARQVAIVDAKGRIAAYTGPKAPRWAGDLQGKTWSAQGNILVGPEVVKEMGRAFASAPGELAEKLFAGLEAGDQAGGDSRGRQAAALLVVGKRRGRNLNNDRRVCVRVDDHPDSIRELGRLLTLNLAYVHQDEAYKKLALGQADEAREALARAAKYSIHPDTLVRLGFLHYLVGDRPAALEAFFKAQSLDPDFEKLWRATVLGRPAFRPALDDKALVEQLFSPKK
jgi:uncharacterized Ntn-hydrolase superfamily protein